MDIEKFRTFIAASRCSNFYEAADTLFITPSTVSKHISALEKELGAVLFKRAPGKLTLTEQGLSCLSEAEQIVAAYDRLRELIAAPKRGALRILTIFEQSSLLCVIRAFSRRYPDIRIELDECHGNEVVQSILSGKYALGVAGSAYTELPELERCVFGEQRIVAALPGGHPLAGRERISLSELSGEAFFLLHPESGAYQSRVNMCLAHGFRPNVKRTCSRDELLLESVREGGVTLVGEHALRRFPFPDVCAVPLSETYYLGGALIRLRGRSFSPEARCFWDFFVQSVKDGKLSADH